MRRGDTPRAPLTRSDRLCNDIADLLDRECI